MDLTLFKSLLSRCQIRVRQVFGLEKRLADLEAGGGGTSNHALLTHLPYAEAGHTGFQPALGFTAVPETRTVNGQALTGNITIPVPPDELLSNALSTGWLWGGEISINTDPIKINITAGGGLFVDNTTDPENPTRAIVTWDAFTAQTDPYIATSEESGVAINSSGALVWQSSSEYTEEQHRDLIILGWTVHLVGDVVEDVFDERIFAADTTAQLHDFFDAFGAFNVWGNDYGAASNDLTILRSAGKTFDSGTNTAAPTKNPNILTTNLEDPVVDYYYYYQSAPNVWVNDDAALTEIDPEYYDTGSGKAAVPTGKWTIQTIFYYAPWQTTDIQYGQVVYDTMAEAQSALNTIIAINPWVAWDTFRAWLIVQQGATDLSDTDTALFQPAGKLGMVSVAAGGGTGGEINTASNEGLSGIGVYLQKTGVNLELKNIRAASAKLSVANNGTEKTVDIDLGTVTTADVADSVDKRYCTDAEKSDIAAFDTHIALTTTAHGGLLPSTAFVGFAKLTVAVSAPGSPGAGDLWVDLP